MRVTATCITAPSPRTSAATCPRPTAQVLDYGCGEATSADLVAEASGHLTLVEAAPNVRAALKARYAGNPKISVLTPEEARGAAGRTRSI